MSTFGIIIPGRPVDTNFQQVDTNKFLITIANAETINHVVVFLTGLIQLPADVAGCIYFSLPDPNAPPTWHYLGCLTSEKPSAIYKLTNLTQSKLRATNGQLIGNPDSISGNNVLPMQSINSNGTNMMNFNYVQAPVHHVAQIGISIEPLAVVSGMVPAIQTSASKANSFSEFINKTASNLFNYCSSFSRSLGDGTSTQYVPLSTIQSWYENYMRRLSNDENFWRTLN